MFASKFIWISYQVIAIEAPVRTAKYPEVTPRFLKLVLRKIISFRFQPDPVYIVDKMGPEVVLSSTRVIESTLNWSFDAVLGCTKESVLKICAIKVTNWHVERKREPMPTCSAVRRAQHSEITCYSDNVIVKIHPHPKAGIFRQNFHAEAFRRAAVRRKLI
ncbi:hypothetical protein C8R44DRAFT_735293 [Mycena epipterygia]|nr:hypothetical protein C8R44DRAFT_735293 [Mycena epipterygia]